MNQITRKIISWYQQNKRDFPWREDMDPYHVWISEVMLQQTRIEAVRSYYERFMQELPTIDALAEVEEEKLLKLWEGLGYYNRARNLKKSAILIKEKYHGIFPRTYEEILSLPGIGEYTASAIASLCFSIPKVTIDGNVLRVYTRLFEENSIIDLASTKKKIGAHLLKLIPKGKESGDFNAGLMELGETICLPNGVPQCFLCPLQSECKAKKHHTVMNYPVRKKKKEKQVEKLTVLLFHKEDQFYIEKRKEKGVLSNLWQFPNLEGFLSEDEVKEYCVKEKIFYQKIKKSITYTHVFTHKKWEMQSYIIEVTQPFLGTWVREEDLEQSYSIPSAFQPFKKIIIEEGENTK